MASRLASLFNKAAFAVQSFLEHINNNYFWLKSCWCWNSHSPYLDYKIWNRIDLYFWSHSVESHFSDQEELNRFELVQQVKKQKHKSVDIFISKFLRL